MAVCGPHLVVVWGREGHQVLMDTTAARRGRGMERESLESRVRDWRGSLVSSCVPCRSGPCNDPAACLFWVHARPTFGQPGLPCNGCL